MEKFIDIILQSGSSAVDLALYTLLPIMVIMMAFMKLLEAKGVVYYISKILAPILKYFGIPGIGVFAALQLSFISFAAPLATLKIMEDDKTSEKLVASTLAMVLAMSQANVIFPMITVGLDIKVVLITSLLGGLFAAVTTYYIFGKNLVDEKNTEEFKFVSEKNKSTFNLLVSAGQEAVEVVIKSLPIILIAIFFVNLIETLGIIDFIGNIMAPVFSFLGLSPYATLPIITKFLAGGTAMMGVTLDMINQGIMSAQELNKLAGLIINPFDPVGIAVLVSAGRKTSSVIKPALFGAIAGIILKTIIHLIIY